MDQATFDALLMNLSNSDNALRNGAEAQYNQMRDADPLWVMHALTETCATTTNTTLPPMAIILLRKLFARNVVAFDHATPEVRTAIKGRLLQIFGQSADKSHSRSVAACISALAAKVVALNDTWDDLWVNLFATIQNPSSSSAHRGVCCEVLNHTATVLASTYLKGHMRELAAGLQLCLTDPSVEVKKSAFSALQAVTQILDKSDLPLFRPLVGTVLGVVEASLNSQDWATTKALFLALTDCIEHSIDLFNDHVVQVLQATMQVASSPVVPKEVRHLAAEAMVTFCESNPKAVKKTQGFAKALFDLLFQYILNPEIPADWDLTRDDPDADDLEGISDVDVGCTSLDRLATTLPPKQLQAIAQEHFMTNISSPQWQNRNAALIMLTYVSEGLRQVFIEHLGGILQFVLPATTDEHKLVRHSAIQCLSQFSCDFCPEMQTQFHEQVVPVLRQALHDPIPRIASNAASAMNSFFDNAEDGDEDESAVEERLSPYVHDCCGELVHVYNTATINFVKGDCLGAMSSIISTCKAALAPYVNDLVPLFQGVLAMTEDDSQAGKEIRIMKCKAVECTTLLACGVGKAHFSAYAHPVCEYLNSILASGLTNDDPRLRYILRGWTCMVECLKEDVLPYLPSVLPPLLAVANMECDLEIVDNEVGDDDDEEEEEGVERIRLALKGKGEQTVKIKTALIEDKELATTIIMSIMGELKGKLAPYLPQISQMALKNLQFCATSDVRENACEIISEMVDAYKEAVPAEIPNLIRTVSADLLKAIKEETDISTMGQELTALTKVLGSLAGVLVEAEVREVAEVLHLVFKDSIERRKDLFIKKQQEQDEEEQEALADEDETEQFLLQECVGTLQSLLSSCGPLFLPLFEAGFLPMLTSLVNDEDSGYKKVALTGYCDFVEFGGAASLPHIPTIAGALLRYTADADEEICQASFYGLGLVAELVAVSFPQPHAESTQFAATAAGAIAAYLSNAKAKKPEFADCTCNVVSSSLKIIDKFGAAGVFDSTRLFQQTLVFLPVEGDVVESERVHEKVLLWVVQGHPSIAAVPSSKQMILAALKKTKLINDATRQQLSMM